MQMPYYGGQAAGMMPQMHPYGASYHMPMHPVGPTGEGVSYDPYSGEHARWATAGAAPSHAMYHVPTYSIPPTREELAHRGPSLLSEMRNDRHHSDNSGGPAVVVAGGAAAVQQVAMHALPGGATTPHRVSIPAQAMAQYGARQDSAGAASAAAASAATEPTVTTHAPAGARAYRVPLQPVGMAAHVREYAASVVGGESRYDTAVTIYSPRVVQKSYGSEKRFFCPPPFVVVSQPAGGGLGDPSIQFSLEGAGGTFDEQAVPELTSEGHTAKARFLFISNKDKAKQFHVRVRVRFGHFRDSSVFQSAPVKVISKPSKRKFSMSNMNMRIESGEPVALFNRVRSQSGSTRFLRSADTSFESSMNKWSTFVIRGESDFDASQRRTDFIHYNMCVVLESTESGVLSAP
jgi:hypothetical protein